MGAASREEGVLKNKGSQGWEFHLIIIIILMVIIIIVIIVIIVIVIGIIRLQNHKLAGTDSLSNSALRFIGPGFGIVNSCRFGICRGEHESPL